MVVWPGSVLFSLESLLCKPQTEQAVLFGSCLGYIISSSVLVRTGPNHIVSVHHNGTCIYRFECYKIIIIILQFKIGLGCVLFTDLNTNSEEKGGQAGITHS